MDFLTNESDFMGSMNHSHKFSDAVHRFYSPFLNHSLNQSFTFFPHPDFSPDAIFSEMEFLKSSQAVLITLYSATGLLSIVGNIVSIIVLTLGNRAKKDLNRYLLNMAIADLTMATFCIPFTFTQVMLGRWVFGWVMCPVVNCMQVTSVAVSIYTNVAIGIDRYLAVARPLRQRLTRTNTRFVILVIWIFSLGLGSSQLFISKAKQKQFGPVTFWECAEIFETFKDRLVYNFSMFFITYLIPLVLLALVYAHIACTLWRRELPGNADAARDQQRIQSKRRVTKMLVVLVIAFAVCWLPLHLFILIIDLAPSVMDGITPSSPAERIFLGLFYGCHWLAMVGCLTNPFIYCFLNESFRADLMYLLRHSQCRHCFATRGEGVQDRHQRTGSSLSLLTRTLFRNSSRSITTSTVVSQKQSDERKPRGSHRTSPRALNSSRIGNGVTPFVDVDVHVCRHDHGLVREVLMNLREETM